MNTDVIVNVLQSKGLYTKIIRELTGHECVVGTNKIDDDGHFANTSFLILQTDDGLWVAEMSVAGLIRTSTSMDDAIKAISAFYEMGELHSDDSITIGQAFSILRQAGMTAILMNQMEIAVYEYRLVEEEMINRKYPYLDDMPIAFTIQLHSTMWIINDKRLGKDTDSITVETLRKAVNQVITLKVEHG